MTDTAVPTPSQLVAPRHMVLGLLANLRAGVTQLVDSTMEVDSAIFVDPDIAQLEIDGVFGAVPFIAAHSSQVANPHDVLAKRLPRNEVIITRQADGSVRTLVNVCRHRGTMIQQHGTDHCRVFSCPYHGWSYDIDGSLRSVSFEETFGEIDKSTRGLVELPTEERHGFIWVIDNPTASIDVAAWLGPETDAMLASYGIEHLVNARTGEFDQPINWKILHDAFLDGYHIKFVHSNSAARVVHSNTYVVEDYGNHRRFTSPRKSFDQWLDHDPEPDEPMLGQVMMAHHIGPNSTLLQLEDHFELLSFYPISDNPAEGRMEMSVLVPPREATPYSQEAWDAHWDKNWNILQVVLTGEDFPVLRSIQQAYASRSRSSMVLGRNEILNQAFHRDIARLRDVERARRAGQAGSC